MKTDLDAPGYFKRLAFGLPTLELLGAIYTRPDLWKLITTRQDYPGSAHHDTECIFLRWCADHSLEAAFRDLDADWLPNFGGLPEAVDLLLKCVPPDAVKQLGRVMVAKLKPGGIIDLHSDEGAYAEHFQRYHVSLLSDEGNLFFVDGKPFHAQPGELWWFNHRKPHMVVNKSQRERIHLIVDAVPC